MDHEPVDITKVMTVDSQVINYGKFICGKMLGSTIQITNTSSQEHILELSVDQQNEEYNCDEIFGPYQRDELPYSYKDGSMIQNSEKVFQSWYVENPITQELAKNLTLRVEA